MRLSLVNTGRGILELATYGVAEYGWAIYGGSVIDFDNGVYTVTNNNQRLTLTNKGD